MNLHRLLPERPYRTYSDYLAATGASAVAKARAMTPDAVLAEIQQSGLRGRGGAGFPTGVKWSAIRKHPCPKRSVVCNAAEGEPGTFKDRFLLRRNPYATLEGMLIAARTVGAAEIYLAIKESFTAEIERLRGAIDEMGAAITIVEGPEEYLFGEEKALLNVIEGAGPLPREAHYPPYEVGLFATAGSPNPALVNNAQTFAHVPSILRHGGTSFAKLGTKDTPGSLLFTVCGDVKRPGVYEREAGIPLRELFQEVAGGPGKDGFFKAALSGVSNGVIPVEYWDTPADFGSLAKIGSGLGSAGFIVLDGSARMPRVARAVARFLYVESCAQCTACKAGLREASEKLDAAGEVGEILRAARSAPQANRCTLPVQAAKLISSLIDQYEEEFEHVHAGPPHWPIPKIVDYDEKKGEFIYDARQALKQPDWTYSGPPKRGTRVRKPEPATVKLDPDVRQAFGPDDLDRKVNEALREWLRNRP